MLLALERALKETVDSFNSNTKRIEALISVILGCVEWNSLLWATNVKLIARFGEYVREKLEAAVRNILLALMRIRWL